ncbi:Hypothetical Protein FCC1311_055132 [Hondaea fermentalgiana]|uniref:Uncharacterized protein n=1 Tax=Hondaea fermentalgiana TaxID=2315210 RepID=A0A2R5GLX8_9STRA|nr:Hypothetical Protein FCC1311_055132 [Hondaea fermentalgiana]|eukprot:GBG29291.1 Hypothetical Protein FCC1311_055132 [Hondaea fermentalgiana]
MEREAAAAALSRLVAGARLGGGDASELSRLGSRVRSLGTRVEACARLGDDCLREQPRSVRSVRCFRDVLAGIQEELEACDRLCKRLRLGGSCCHGADKGKNCEICMAKFGRLQGPFADAPDGVEVGDAMYRSLPRLKRRKVGVNAASPVATEQVTLSMDQLYHELDRISTALNEFDESLHACADQCERLEKDLRFLCKIVPGAKEALQQDQEATKLREQQQLEQNENASFVRPTSNGGSQPPFFHIVWLDLGLFPLAIAAYDPKRFGDDKDLARRRVEESLGTRKKRMRIIGADTLRVVRQLARTILFRVTGRKYEIVDIQQEVDGEMLPRKDTDSLRALAEAGAERSFSKMIVLQARLHYKNHKDGLRKRTLLGTAQDLMKKRADWSQQLKEELDIVVRIPPPAEIAMQDETWVEERKHLPSGSGPQRHPDGAANLCALGMDAKDLCLVLPSVFMSEARAKKLDISLNALSSLAPRLPRSLACIDGLRELDLSGTGLGPSELVDCLEALPVRLEVLALSHLPIFGSVIGSSEALAAAVDRLSMLRVLRLNDSIEHTSEPVKAYGPRVARLDVLDFSHCKDFLQDTADIKHLLQQANDAHEMDLLDISHCDLDPVVGKEILGARGIARRLNLNGNSRICQIASNGDFMADLLGGTWTELRITDVNVFDWKRFVDLLSASPHLDFLRIKAAHVLVSGFAEHMECDEAPAPFFAEASSAQAETGLLGYVWNNGKQSALDIRFR